MLSTRDSSSKIGSSHLPLSGVRVVDATHLVAGPFCSMLLADAGADVIKVERPKVGELARTTSPMVPFAPGQDVSARFLYLNRNKRSITLDLRQPTGKQAFEALVGVSDVVVDNWGPGSLSRLGLDYERLRSINPSIIYAGITGYGAGDDRKGPYSDWAANNPCAQAMGGWMEVTGDPDCPPHMVGDNVGDSIPALWTVYGILLALETRRKTGLGQYLDMAMYDCMVAHNTGSIAVYQATGVPPGRRGENMASPLLTLRAKDGYVVLSGAREEGKWVALWRLLGREDLLQDPRYLIQGSDGEFFINQIQPRLEEWTRDVSRWDVTQTLLGLGFSAAMVQSAEDLLDCPHLESREMWSEIERPTGGRFVAPSNPVKLSGAVQSPASKAPMLGEHNEEILGGLLGFGSQELEHMRSQGTI